MYAKGVGLDNEFHHAAAKALWEDGANLGEMPVLKEIAEKVGLDWAELAERLESEQHREEVFQESQAARDLGVGGTPTYRVGGELIWQPECGRLGRIDTEGKLAPCLVR